MERATPAAGSASVFERPEENALLVAEPILGERLEVLDELCWHGGDLGARALHWPDV